MLSEHEQETDLVFRTEGDKAHQPKIADLSPSVNENLLETFLSLPLTWLCLRALITLFERGPGYRAALSQFELMINAFDSHIKKNRNETRQKLQGVHASVRR